MKYNIVEKNFFIDEDNSFDSITKLSKGVKNIFGFNDELVYNACGTLDLCCYNFNDSVYKIKSPIVTDYYNMSRDPKKILLLLDKILKKLMSSYPPASNGIFPFFMTSPIHANKLWMNYQNNSLWIKVVDSRTSIIEYRGDRYVFS